MEEQLTALGLGAGARVAECLHESGRPLLWNELYAVLEDEFGSRGTLTKTLTRLIKADLVARENGRYRLRHPDLTASVLRSAAGLEVAVAEARLDSARRRRRSLVVTPVPDARDEQASGA